MGRKFESRKKGIACCCLHLIALILRHVLVYKKFIYVQFCGPTPGNEAIGLSYNILFGREMSGLFFVRTCTELVYKLLGVGRNGITSRFAGNVQPTQILAKNRSTMLNILCQSSSVDVQSFSNCCF